MATLSTFPIYIGYGTSLSTAVDLGASYVCGLVMPDKWTAARVTIQASTDGALFHDLFDFDIETRTTATEVMFNVVPSAMVAVDPHTLLMARYIKLRSGTRDEPIEQAETCMFTLITVNSLT